MLSFVHSTGGGESIAQRFAPLQALVRARHAARETIGEQGWDEPPSLLAFAPSDRLWQVPVLDADAMRRTFPARAQIRLGMSGGGLRNHNFDVAELQAARRAFHVLWIATDLWRGLQAELGGARLAHLLSLLPLPARGARPHGRSTGSESSML